MLDEVGSQVKLVSLLCSFQSLLIFWVRLTSICVSGLSSSQHNASVPPTFRYRLHCSYRYSFLWVLPGLQFFKSNACNDRCKYFGSAAMSVAYPIIFPLASAVLIFTFQCPFLECHCLTVSPWDSSSLRVRMRVIHVHFPRASSPECEGLRCPAAFGRVLCH